MDVADGIDALTMEHGRLFLVIGVFDGLHRGHRYLLGHLRREAGRRNARPAVLTFDAHPDQVIVGAAPPLLCDPDERLARLAAAGVAVTIVVHFNEAMRATPYDMFVRTIAARVELAGILMTPDAAFGHERRGTPAAVAELGAQVGFDVVVVPPLELDGRPVRSGTIRVDIAAGDLNGARRLLGRPVAVVGEVARELNAAPRSEPREVRLAMPMALPPQGTYRGSIEPAWTAEGRRGRARRTFVTVADDAIRVGGASAGRDRRVRVAFSVALIRAGTDRG